MSAVVPSVTTPEVVANWLLRSRASIKTKQNKTKQNTKQKQNKTKTKNYSWSYLRCTMLLTIFKMNENNYKIHEDKLIVPPMVLV